VLKRDGTLILIKLRGRSENEFVRSATVCHGELKRLLISGGWAIGSKSLSTRRNRASCSAEGACASDFWSSGP